ncbi:glycerophosphodiester phosphodiesterase family protein [Enterovibrio paralichthyis]|uniref:glycerophosphodiester phosphodiesterase family protein n=1 Tax=Enterovibrio paralichthyis TaxID=2853805 RepID=UPI001C478C3E|nr:glycerophosphodiester phosphodiesterase family protein [Enterovibrio paralichthyis]MBV7297655.1 glycerophosphoryl diester phosphodiesterase [Enterovibrio paralichthyis]
MIIGHRGVAALAPENTLLGINAAADLGIKWVELDVQLTRDNVPVLFHDESVNRCTNGIGRLDLFTLAQLRELDAGAWFNARFEGEKVPTLEETLTLCAQRGISINLEIKCHSKTAPGLLVEKVAEVIKSTGYPNENLLLSSFSLPAIEHCLAMLPDCRVGLITEQTSPAFLDDIEPLNIFSVHCDQRHLSLELADAILSRGYQLNIWTLNEARKAQYFRGLGVTHIITDDPVPFSE